MSEIYEDQFDTEDDGPFDIEMLDVTEGYFALIDKIACQNVGALETIGGNFMIHVFDVGTRTIVSSGEGKGIFDEPTDDELDFVFCLPQWVLLHVLEPDDQNPIDLEALIEREEVVFDGDPKIYQKFMDLGRKQKNLLSIRAGM